MKTITIDECTKMIRAALKQGFPNTKFSVRKERSTYSFNINVRWEDGPTEKQVKPILDRFVSKGFDGMVDLEYSCGKRVLAGVEVKVSGGYVTGSRSISPRLRQIIADKVAAECGLPIPVRFNEHGGLADGDRSVPFDFHGHWRDEKPFTVPELQETTHILSHNSHRDEWFSTLMYRVEIYVSLEEQQPIAAELLPEYIDVNADVETCRAPNEPKQKMFEGHAALDAEQKAIEEFETAPLVPAGFHCSIGRRYSATMPSGHLQKVQ